MEWNGGMEKGWNSECTQLQLTHVTGAVVQGCAGYYVSTALISPRRLYEQVQCCQHSSLSGIMMSWSKLRVAGNQLHYHAWGGTVTTLKEDTTKVVTED